MTTRHAVCALALLLISSPSAAGTWTEVGDAGNLPATAQVTVGLGALTSIQGTLSSNSDQDMYCIRVTDPANFLAYLNCVVFADNDVWLFDVSDIGVAHNDGCTGGQTWVGAPLVTLAGIYYLAVSPSDDDALNGTFPIWNPPAAAGQRGPDGTGAPGPITGWSNAGVVSSFNNYTLSLQGCEFCDAPTGTDIDTWGRLKRLYR